MGKYPKYKKITLLEVVNVLSNGDYVVQNEGDPSDQWIIPKATFEGTYKKATK